MLSLSLLPDTARANALDHLEIGGCDLCAVADEYSTPLYIFDEATLRAQALRAKSAFEAHWPQVQVLYASKAYFAPFLARLYKELGLGVEVTSEAEIAVARRAGLAPAAIYFHGNNKTRPELRAALSAGIRHIVVDNLGEIPLLDELAREYDVPLQLCLRLRPAIDSHTHRFLATGTADSKFGLGIEDGQAEAAAQIILSSSALELVGLHLHVGSQVFDINAFDAALDIALDTAAIWQARWGWHLSEVDLGGGWGVAYDATAAELDVEALGARIGARLRAGLRARGLDENVRLLAEPGRALVARAGVALYRVGALKSVAGGKTYAFIDGGMGDNIRPALYGARYSAVVANRAGQAHIRDYIIAGRYCEQGDVLIPSACLPPLAVGDLLAVPMAGAYQLPMASNYNLMPRPPVVLARDGRAVLVRRRETVGDLLACDVV